MVEVADEYVNVYKDNQVIDTVGYHQGYRISSSSGNLSKTTSNEYVATNLIDINKFNKPVSIILSGIVFNNSLHTNTCYANFGWHKSKGENKFISGGYLTDGNFNEFQGNYLSVNENNEYTILLKPENLESNNCNGIIRQIRATGYGLAEDIIVTIQQ